MMFHEPLGAIHPPRGVATIGMPKAMPVDFAFDVLIRLTGVNNIYPKISR